MLALIRHKLFSGCFSAIQLVSIWVLLISNPVQSQELIVTAEDFVYEEQAISIVFDASPDLNSISGRPHSLVIGVFQLSDPNTFTGLATTREGAVQLLDNGPVDDTIASFQRIVVLPGERSKLVLARSRRAQYVGFIVGYFRLAPKWDVSIFPVPISTTENSNRAKPGKLSISIKLGGSNTLHIVSQEQPED